MFARRRASRGLKFLVPKTNRGHLCPVIDRYFLSATFVQYGTGEAGGAVLPNSGSLSTLIRAESRHYSGKTQYMFENKPNFGYVTAVNGTNSATTPPSPHYPPPLHRIHSGKTRDYFHIVVMITRWRYCITRCQQMALLSQCSSDH